MTEITPPPSAEAAIEAERRSHMWPLRPETQKAMIEAGMTRIDGKLKIQPRVMFDLALKLEFERLVPNLVAAWIERISAGEPVVLQLRVPMPHDIRNSKRTGKKVYRVIPAPIPREMMYHFMLDMPAPPLESVTPDDATADEKPPILFGPEGDPIVPVKEKS